MNTSEPTIVEITALPESARQYVPDASFRVSRAFGGGFYIHVALSQSWVMWSQTPYLEDAEDAWSLRIRGRRQSWENGGQWISSVHQVRDGTIGFYHAEDHWEVPNPERKAWKSIAVTHSRNGLTWERGSQVITAHRQQPNMPEWGGAGDHIVINDRRSRRWVCYFSERSGNNHRICAAMSQDPSGLTGWLKFRNGDFGEPGLGGKTTALFGLDQVPGANPFVAWSRPRQRWVMVWHGWDGKIYLSMSIDGLRWDDPQLVAEPSVGYTRAWYPTLIDPEHGTEMLGENVFLYYAEINDAGRRMVYRDLEL